MLEPSVVHLTVGGQLVGQEAVPPLGSTVSVTAVQAYGNGDKLVSAVTLAGGVNGTFYLQGKPAVASDGRTIEIRQLNFSMETSNVLARIGTRIMYDTIREQVVQNSRIAVGDRIEAPQIGPGHVA